jgi:hypothetical protein
MVSDFCDSKNCIEPRTFPKITWISITQTTSNILHFLFFTPWLVFPVPNLLVDHQPPLSPFPFYAVDFYHKSKLILFYAVVGVSCPQFIGGSPTTPFYAVDFYHKSKLILFNHPVVVFPLHIKIPPISIGGYSY